MQEFCEQFQIDRRKVPLDVEVIVESDLKLELLPESGVFKACGADALLLSNRKTIIVDYDRFMKDSWQNRLRFTIAHEIGHYVLHEHVFKDVTFSSVEEWANFFESIPDESYNWLEWQCDEFAGRLLIEGELLRQKFDESVKEAKARALQQKTTFPDPIPEWGVETLCGPIGQFFGVSAQPVYIRLQREGIWLPT